MEAEIVVSVWGADTDTFTKPVVHVSGHPGFGAWWSNHWADILTIGTEGAAALYGVGALGAKEAVESFKKIFGGSDQQYMEIGAFDITKNSGYDHARVSFRAWSEDDLKKETCKAPIIPPEAFLIYEKFSGKEYEIIYEFQDINKLSSKRYPFVFGAQDDGWMYDVAVSAEADIQIHENPDALRVARGLTLPIRLSH